MDAKGLENKLFIPTNDEIKKIQKAFLELGKMDINLYKASFEELYIKIAEETKIC
jgi:hypothetical protein